MERNGEKDSDGLLNAVRRTKLRRTVISKRLEAGRTIQLDLQTKAQLLTIISGTEEKQGLSSSLIIQKDRIPRIVISADPFAPEVSLYVYTVENPSKKAKPTKWKPGHVATVR